MQSWLWSKYIAMDSILFDSRKRLAWNRFVGTMASQGIHSPNLEGNKGVTGLSRVLEWCSVSLPSTMKCE